MPDKECPNCDGAGRDSCPLCSGTNEPFPEEDEKDFGEIVAGLVAQGLSDQEIFDHLDSDSRETDVIAFIRIRMEKGFDHQMPPEDMVSYLEIAYVAMDAHADTIVEILDISDDEMERLTAQLYKILHRPEGSEVCVKCDSTKVKPEDFKDDSSRGEYKISHFCQKCQDDFSDQIGLFLTDQYVEDGEDD